ncbi:septum site-determining protein Ssd [Arthrobacter sp.]|uniref:septum site-determining protein Ssd n=1 Tax=Arthrobacter sp. TaxID=1667 RepID=UPI0026E09AE6|nr:septum site-determining protein Ssd [Arthrobacter sp.]MDO5753402.1 hypothetical protein [Arthrobacter sp.]
MRHSQIPSPGPAVAPWLPHRDTTVVLLSASAELQGAVGKVSAAAAVELLVGQGLEQVEGRWDDVAAVLFDAEVLSGAAIDAGLAGWRGPTAVVGFHADAAQMWQQAERMGADRVAILPDSAPWLANYLSFLRNPVAGAGVLGVAGGCGGAGASTLSILIAAGAAAAGTRTLLVDGDPWGGGLCTALAAVDVPGLRWQELLQASGAINPEHLAVSLPQLGHLSLLSWGSGFQQEAAGPMPPAEPWAAASTRSAEGVRTARVWKDRNARAGPGSGPRSAAGEVMRAARGAYGLVVVDLGRNPEAFAELAPQCNGLAVVIPGRVRAAAATLHMLATMAPMPTAAVVRGPLAEGLDAAMVAAAVGLPLVGWVPALRGVTEALEAQRLPELLRRRPVRRLVSNVLEWMAGESAHDARTVDRRLP